MFDNVSILGKLSHGFLIVVLVILAVFLMLSLLRLILGPCVADRLLASNVTGNITIATIVILGIVLNESFLLDIGLVYALISFLAVIVLSQIYTGVFKKKNAAILAEEERILAEEQQIRAEEEGTRAEEAKNSSRENGGNA